MANPLDVFSIVFNSDGLKEFEQKLKKNEQEVDKYEKQIESLEQKLRDLEAAEEKDTKAIAQTGKALQEAKEKTEFFKKSVATMQESTMGKLLALRNNFTKLAKVVGSLAFVTATIKKSLDFYEQGEQLEFLAEKTGLAVEKLQLLGNAAKKYGGTTEGIAGTVENLRSQYQDARMGNVSGGMKNAYMKYGFTISSDPEQTLQRLAKRMETMKSDTAKWDLAKNLGIDEGTTRLLIQGQAKYNEELKKASKYKLYTKEDIQRMRDYRQISGDIRMGIESIFASIARMLLPAITAVAKVVRNVTDFLSKHEGLIQLTALILGVTLAVLGVTLAVKNFAVILPFLTKGVKGLGVAIKALFSPIGIWIGLITLVILAVQDFIVFLQGGESATGAILKKMGFDVNKVRQNCLNFFNSIKTGIKSAIDWLKSLGGKFSELAGKIKEFWEAIPDPFKKLIGMSNPLTAGFTLVTTGQQIMKQANESRYNPVPKGAIAAANQTQAITNNNSEIKNSNRNTHINNNTTINVTTNDPREIARQVPNYLPYLDLDNGRMT